jgi:hypothetical protein
MCDRENFKQLVSNYLRISIFYLRDATYSQKAKGQGAGSRMTKKPKPAKKAANEEDDIDRYKYKKMEYKL